MTSPSEWSRRDMAYRKRLAAIAQAARRETTVMRGINVATLALQVASLVILWPRLDAKVLVIDAAVTFALWWSMRLVVYVAWVHPTIARIDREFPKPPPLETKPHA